MEGNFEPSFAFLLTQEGGFAKLPHDEITNHGVKRSTWSHWVHRPVTESEMASLTPADVKPLYRTLYWDTILADQLPSGIDYAVFDYGVHSGIYRAVKTLQDVVGVISDGRVGKLTLASTKAYKSTSLLKDYMNKRRQFARSLKNYPFFKKGWEARFKKVEEFSKKQIEKEQNHGIL